MSDFNFARKTSNLSTLLYQGTKADRASASYTQSTGYKGNYCRESRFIRAWTCSNIRICLFWLVTWCKKQASVNAFGKVESEIRLFWRSLVASADLQSGVLWFA